MGVGWLVACGVAWVGSGVWWATSRKAGAALHRIGRFDAIGPALLLASLLVAVVGAMTLPRPPLTQNGKLSDFGWLTALVIGAAFVSLQALGARAVAARMFRAKDPETSAAPGTSNRSENGTS